MKEHWIKLKEWWAPLAEREKYAVAIGGLFLSLLIVYEAIIAPFFAHLDELRTRIVAEQKLLVWMDATDKQLQKAEGKEVKHVKILSPVILLSMVKQQVSHVNLSGELVQLKQASNESIEMHFQKVEFDKLVTLLMAISKAANVGVSQLSVSTDNTPGIVNADVVLKII